MDQLSLGLSVVVVFLLVGVAFLLIVTYSLWQRGNAYRDSRDGWRDVGQRALRVAQMRRDTSRRVSRIARTLKEPT